MSNRRSNYRLAATDLSCSHGTLYAHMRRPCPIRYTLNALNLFAQILWRRWDDQCARIDLVTAAQVSFEIWTYRRDFEIWKQARQFPATPAQEMT